VHFANVARSDSENYASGLSGRQASEEKALHYLGRLPILLRSWISSYSRQLFDWVPSLGLRLSYASPRHLFGDPFFPAFGVNLISYWYIRSSVFVAELDITARADFIRRALAIPRLKAEVITAHWAQVAHHGVHGETPG
jgi:hypothetical protein